MIKLYVIEIKKDIIPYYFNVLLGDTPYEMQINYNYTANLFTVTLSKGGTILCIGEPIVYGVPLFNDLLTRGNFPKVTITPIDESGETIAVTFDNLSSTVLLKVTGGVYDE